MNHPQAKLSSLSTAHTASITCSACNGAGSKESHFYSTTLTTNCRTCKGTGSITICTSCGGKLSYSRKGVVCGCSSFVLKVAV